MNKADSTIILNPMQILVEIAPQSYIIVQVGRGGGKSFIIGFKIKNVVYDMPRSKNFIISGTYQQALTKTLPSTINALDRIGFKKDLHFFVGRLPPPKWKWPKCYEAPEDPKHSIFFYNGTVYDILSQDTNSRGANYASGVGDEAQDLDQHKFESQVLPTMRLEYEKLKNNKHYRSLLLACSMPRTRKGEWIFNYEEFAKKEPDKYLFISGPSAVNKHNLPPDWFTDQRRILMPSEYEAEILNIRPKKVVGGFYPFFDDKKHTYTEFNNDYLTGLLDNANGYQVDTFSNLTSLQDSDILADQPLEISMDYGSWFNGIVTCQEYNNIFRYLSAISIDEHSRFDELLERWCNYYRFHKCKTVHYWYDHTAKDPDARSEEYYIIVCRVLRNHGWNVIEQYIGQQPGHDDRYKFFGYAHKNDHPELPIFEYNRHHCKYLIISLNGAEIIQGKNGYEKKKVDEKNHKIDQRTTTHFSDAHDTIAMGKYAERLNGKVKIAGARTHR